MQKHRRLKDEYRYPGFVPLTTVKGVFGDPRAVIISLRRCRKKRAAATAVGRVDHSMTSVRERFVICLAATSESISRSICVEFAVLGVVP